MAADHTLQNRIARFPDGPVAVDDVFVNVLVGHYFLISITNPNSHIVLGTNLGLGSGREIGLLRTSRVCC